MSLSQKVKLVFSHPQFVVGFFISLFFGLFMAIFSQDFYLIDEYKLSAAPVETKGEILAIEETNASSNDELIFKYHFSYALENPEGSKEWGNGWSYNTWDNKQVGDTVTVTYAKEAPGVAVIKGHTLSIFGIWATIILGSFTLISLTVTLFGLKKGIKSIRKQPLHHRKAW
ncbi:DUF3592 domain-containing protein [Limibacter armeniacum]|uniref:DUF3592 domain-containing protein n=1 Tax=Limibacter armeniacum TaxID=466084 RepID=UPI002FE5AE5A